MNPIHQTFRNFTTKILVLGISLLVSLLIPGILGPGLFGLYSLIIAWVGFLIPITSFGIGAGILYYISNKSHSFQSVFSTNLFIAILIGLFNFFILFLFYLTGLLNRVDSSVQLSEFCMLAGSILFQSINYIVGRAWLGDSKFDYLNSLDLLNSLLGPGILLMALWYFSIKDTSFIYWSYLITSFLALMYTCFLVRTQVLWKSLDVVYLKQAFRYGLKSWIGDIALKANLRLDQLILGTFFSLNALGIYSVAVKLVELVWMIPDTIGPLLFNMVAGNSNQKDNVSMISRIHRITLTFCFVVIILWIFICHLLIVPYVLGDEFTEVSKIMMLLAPGIFIMVSSKIITKLFSASGNVMWTSNITIIGSAIGIVLYLLLIPWLGASGAAIASTTGYFCLASAGWIVLILNYKVHFKEFCTVKKEDLLWMKFQWITLFGKKHSVPKER